MLDWFRGETRAQLVTKVDQMIAAFEKTGEVPIFALNGDTVPRNNYLLVRKIKNDHPDLYTRLLEAIPDIPVKKWSL